MKFLKQTDRKRLAAAAAALAMLAGTVYVAGYFYRQNVHRRQFEELREAARTEQPEIRVPESADATEAAGEGETESLYDFGALRETNGDIYAWITIPGTQVDYPVLQAEEDDYYLDHNLDHTDGYPGCIYTNSCNAEDFTDGLTVLYGHNMKNGSMFGSLHEFGAEDYFREHREILISTEERQMTYEIVAATVFVDLYIPAFYGVNSVEGKEVFLEEIRKSAAAHSGSWLLPEEETGDDDRYVILSTCVNGEDDQRYLVVGRLVQ